MSQHNFTPGNQNALVEFKVNKAIPHKEILGQLLEQIEKIDFRERAGITKENEKVNGKHHLVISIEAILEFAHKNDWGICQNNGSIYLFNSAYWSLVGREELKTFLGQAAEKLGVDLFDARFYDFRDKLLKQFQSASNFPKPELPFDVVLINLMNGTFEIGLEKQQLRIPSRSDFITHQLPFDYDPVALCPIFSSYLYIPVKVSHHSG